MELLTKFLPMTAENAESKYAKKQTLPPPQRLAGNGKIDLRM
jgi:hypothetical protein